MRSHRVALDDRVASQWCLLLLEVATSKIAWWWSILKHAKKIVRCSREVICERYHAHPMRAAKSNTSRACYWATLTFGVGSCGTRRAGLVGWCQLAVEPPSERSIQRGRSLVATKWTSGEKSLCQHCLHHLLDSLHSVKHRLVLLSYNLCLCSCSCD